MKALKLITVAAVAVGLVALAACGGRGNKILTMSLDGLTELAK